MAAGQDGDVERLAEAPQNTDDHKARFACLIASIVGTCSTTNIQFELPTLSQPTMASLATRCLTAQQQQRVALPAAGAGQRRHNAAAAVRCSAGPRQSPFAPLQAVGVGALAAALLLAAGPASADLNRLEAAVGGEFGFGTAMQMGEADAKVRRS
jgi:hypothetical protein